MDRRCIVLSLASRSRSIACEVGEFLDHALIDRPLERHDQRRQVLHRLPAPADEFGLVRAAAGPLDLDLGIGSGEAQCEPFLALAAIAALPGAAGYGAGD